VPVIKWCGKCNKKAKGEFVCGRCFSQGYCGDACGEAHYKAHRKTCKEMRRKFEVLSLARPCKLIVRGVDPSTQLVNANTVRRCRTVMKSARLCIGRKGTTKKIVGNSKGKRVVAPQLTHGQNQADLRIGGEQIQTGRNTNDLNISNSVVVDQFSFFKLHPRLRPASGDQLIMQLFFSYFLYC